MNLHVRFCGIDFKNPVISAASGIAGSAEHIERCVKAGVGGVVTKTITSNPNLQTRPVPTFWPPRFSHPSEWNMWWFGYEGLSHISPEEWANRELPRAKKKCKEAQVPLIASIHGKGGDIDDWAELASLVESSGADMVELNFSCPHFREREQGLMGADPKFVFDVTKGVKKAVRIPVMPKVIPLMVRMNEIAIACEKAGADAISGCNGLPTIFPFIDVETEELCGVPIAVPATPVRAFRRISLAVLYEVLCTVNLPLSGMGGIHKGDDALEYLLLGCTTVQVCRAVYFNGLKVIRKILSDIENFMMRKRYESIEDFRGKIVKKIEPAIKYPAVKPQARYPLEVLPVIDENKCTGCAQCVKCLQTALTMNVELNAPTVRKNRCTSCGWCVSLCPEGAIALKDKSGNVIWHGRGIAKRWPR